MKLGDWAHREGISVRTARRRFHAGTLGVSARQLTSGRIVVDVSADQCDGACLNTIHRSCLVDAVIEALQQREQPGCADSCGAHPAP